MFYDPSQFSFIPSLEANWSIIKEELTQLQAGDFTPWPEKYLYEKGWNVFGLYAFGNPIVENCRLCPQTTALVEGIRGMVTAGFSALAPGTHIIPHTGYTDSVLRCHLGLIVPPECALRVGSEIKAWEAGKCTIFDDTLEHEAWNRSQFPRVVLLLDFEKASWGLS